VLNNPKVREALMGGAATANAKVRQQIESFVQQEVQKATAPLSSRIRELETRVAELEARGGRGAAHPGGTSQNQFDV
jgi:polyhydroxyalkanoate synthesis regulator phasin